MMQRRQPQEEEEEEEEMELLLTDNQQLQLLGQGTYGCAFYPQIDCKTHHITKSSRHFLSKIQFQDKSLIREIQVGKRIVQRVPNYRYLFAPILETCPVKLSEMRQNKIKQCNVLTKATLNNTPIVSSKVPYVGQLTLDKYFNSLYDREQCRAPPPPPPPTTNKTKKCIHMAIPYLKKLINTFLYLLPSFQKLNADVGVVHLDVYAKNIMYDAKNHLPIIIDFGMSYCMDWLQLPAYLSFKYPFGIESFSYAPWCFEVSILTHLARHLRPASNDQLNKHGGYVDETLLKTPIDPELIRIYRDICVDFVTANLRSHNNVIFTDADRQTLIINLQTWIVNLAAKTKTHEALWTALLASYRTWDIYALAIMYLHEIEDSKLLLASTTTAAPVVRAFIDQLKRVILSVPDQRPPVGQIFKEAKTLFAKMTLTNYQQVQAVKLAPAQHQRAERNLQVLAKLVV